MKNNTYFETLRDKLTLLYPDEASARRVVHDAGLDASLILFSTQAKNNWHAILTEALKQQKVHDLLAVVLKEYGDNVELRNACEAFQNHVKLRRDPLHPLLEYPLLLRAGGGIILFIFLILLGYLIFRGTPIIEGLLSPSPTPGPPSVRVLDSKEENQIYNPEEPGTNTARIREILRNLPIQEPIEELVYYEWDGAENLRKEKPDLIIIHNSAFYTETVEADPAGKLTAFLSEMEDTPTKFLIYSRLSSFSDEVNKKQQFEDEFQFLEGRVEVLWVYKSDHCKYWQCSDTRGNLRRKVRALLDLP